jgi:hypothetical protein
MINGMPEPTRVVFATNKQTTTFRPFLLLLLAQSLWSPLTLGVHGRSDPVGRNLQTFHRLVVSDHIGFEISQHRVQLIKLQLLYVHVAEGIRRKGPQLLRRFHRPMQNRIGINLKDSGRGPNAQALYHY